MKRREFLMGATAGVPLFAAGSQSIADAKVHVVERRYHILGIPLRSGSLVPGNENDAQAYRAVQVIKRLQDAGCEAIDEGDLAVPSYLPHHSIPPIRSWPGPHIVWDAVSERLAPILQNERQVPLLIGCDCSVVVGTTRALMRSGQENVHVIYVDGDFDDAAPQPDQCHSAAACALWLLTEASPFCAGPRLKPSQVSVVGWSRPSSSTQSGVRSISLSELRRLGMAEGARQALQAIPASAQVILHFDIDVLQRREMPVAYFPHAEGLTLAEARELFGVLLQDWRIRIIEISEYAALRDLDQTYISKLVDLLADGLKSR